jgi:HK97 family phage prohead protease
MNGARYPNGVEVRSSIEFRASGRKLAGYAATFGTPAAVGRFTETIRAGAFRASLLAPGRDVLALMDHDPARLLARSSNGSLRLAEDAKGLSFELDVPDTSVGRDVLAMAEARLLGGMSFGFRVKEEVWAAADRRELHAVELVEISVVQAFPAYTRTEVLARAAESVEKSVRFRTLRLVVL